MELNTEKISNELNISISQKRKVDQIKESNKKIHIIRKIKPSFHF